MIRRPAVAGRFYPGAEAALGEEVDRLLGADRPGAPAVAVVSPHAGYVYSGGVAGAVFAEVAPPEVAIILAPNHTGMGAPVAVWSEGGWETPLGIAPIEAGLAVAVIDRLEGASADTAAHLHEHSAEVQLPFLQRLNPSVSIVPVVLSRGGSDDLVRLGGALAEVISGCGRNVLIVASSDMTHYEPRDLAEEKDRSAIDRILALDPAGLHETVERGAISMCGVAPTVVAIAAARGLGATTARLVDYRTSGDVTGETAEVVGYAGLVIA